MLKLNSASNDIETRKIIKFLNRHGLLDQKFSGKRDSCEITEREIRGIATHSLNIGAIYDGLRTLLENAGYKNFGHDGFSKNSKSVVLEGDAYRLAKARYQLLKD